MKNLNKLFLGLLFVLFTSGVSFAQDPPYADDFESYTTGGYIGEQNPEWWTTWSGNVGGGEDGMISEDVAMSGSKSVLIDETGGATDLLWLLGDKVSGAYGVDFYMYVPEGYCGYYNFQHMEAPGVEWAFEMYFHTDGTCKFLIAGETLEDYTYAHDTWIYLEHKIDLDADHAELYIDGVFYKDWQWSLQSGGAAGANQLGSIDFYAGGEGTDSPKYYFDDVDYDLAVTVLYEDDFESYTTGGYIGEQNPEWWTTWSGNVGGGEDGMISEDVAMSGSKSVLIDETGGATDLLWLLGDKVSGAYGVDFYMYVPEGYCGYYNFQHMEAPGVEWAFEMYFHTDGTCKFLIAGETLEDYTYAHDTWIYLEHKIDLDADHAELYIDGVFYKDWQWSLQSGGAAGANQLGSIDFYAGGEGTDSPKYYFDDVLYTQFALPTDPEITLDPFSFAQTLNMGQTATQTLTVGNIGETDLEYEIAIVYDLNSDRTPITPSAVLSNNQKFDIACSATPTGNSQSPAATDDEVTLNYDGDNSSAIGWTNAPIDAEVAAMFPTSMTIPHAGMQLTSVFVFINDLGENFKLKVYGMGDAISPGSLLVEQEFSPAAASWHLIELDEPLTITGEDLWVGYSFTQQTTDIFIPGCDAGPNDPNGDWLKTGVGWGHLSSNPDLPYNWNIRANLVGEPITQWLSVDPATGTVVPAGTQDVDVNFDATGIEVGTHGADIVVFSNDPGNSIAYIPVTLTVEDAGATQTISIDPGFQFVSSNVDPENPDMIEVVAEILNDDLVYIRNSTGAMLRKIGPNWVNGIGDWIGTEGYLIKTTATGEFTVGGMLIDPSTPIAVLAGFQFVSYLPGSEMDALEAFASIIGDDLVYVRNSVGAMLRKIGPNWVNGIGNCIPTEGYLIKMSADGELIYPTDGAPASVTSVEKLGEHWNVVGDPTGSIWAIYIGGAYLNVDGYDLEAGDEIAIFDGDLAVGCFTLTQVCTETNQFDNVLNAFALLFDGPGYTVGNEFTLKSWDQSEDLESTGFECIFSNPYGDAYEGTVFPDGEPYSMATLSFFVGIDENAINVAIYPNPVTDILNINSDSKVTNVTVLNYLGQTIDNINVNGMEVTINTSTYDTGIYFIQIETDKGISTQKIIIE